QAARPVPEARRGARGRREARGPGHAAAPGGEEVPRGLAAVTAYQPMLKEGSEGGPAVHDRWARALAEEKKDAGALERSGEGLGAFPKCELLANNGVVVVNQWAKTAMERRDWKEAVRIYRAGLKHLPNNDALQRGLQFCEEQMQKA